MSSTMNFKSLSIGRPTGCNVQINQFDRKAKSGINFFDKKAMSNAALASYTNFQGFSDFEKVCGPLSTKNNEHGRGNSLTETDDVVSGNTNLKNLDFLQNKGKFKTVILNGFLKNRLTI